MICIITFWSVLCCAVSFDNHKHPSFYKVSNSKIKNNSLVYRQNSWKRRFFVLFKMKDESYLLKYFKSSEDREKPYGGIELSKHVLLETLLIKLDSQHMLILQVMVTILIHVIVNPLLYFTVEFRCFTWALKNTSSGHGSTRISNALQTAYSSSRLVTGNTSSSEKTGL